MVGWEAADGAEARCPDPRENTTDWLDRDLGPVKINDWVLLSWAGIVANENRTWGDIKALDR
jgi:hypothetical protein